MIRSLINPWSLKTDRSCNGGQHSVQCRDKRMVLDDPARLDRSPVVKRRGCFVRYNFLERGLGWRRLAKDTACDSKRTMKGPA